jgi:hypothetical protein
MTDTRKDTVAGVKRAQKATTGTVDPRDTDHPTGTEQAAENAATESPS